MNVPYQQRARREREKMTNNKQQQKGQKGAATMKCKSKLLRHKVEENIFSKEN